MWSKEEIGKVIKESRLSAGLTQKQVAVTLGRPQNTISAWEMGRAQPDANTLFELFQVLGADLNEAFGFSTHPFEINKFEQEHIKKYRLLDPYGKEAVDGVLDVESRWCEEARAAALRKERRQMETGELIDFEKIIRFSVPGYTMPMSAGTGQDAGQEYPENYTLVKEPPRGTSFIARVSGVSMEPTYHDGDLVFVHATEEIPVGSIGAFFMDGQQWLKELGDGVLISHNPKYAPWPFTEDIKCQGLVLGVCDKSYFE